jgi:hypothetical protein
MGGMSTEPFKLDLMACIDTLQRCEAANDEESDEGGEPAGAVIDELARQLHAHGAPDTPFEQQAQVMLADHLVMQQAGEEMPSDRQVAVAWWGAKPHDNEFPAQGSARAVLDLFRPIFARLTQERDEWRERAEARLADRGVQEAVTLRQRAERAERIALEQQTEAREATKATADRYVEIQHLRARIAELESRPVREPGSNTLTRAAYEQLVAENLAWLLQQPRSLERDHIEAVLRDSPQRVYGTSSSRPEPGADVVERLYEAFLDGKAAADMSRPQEPNEGHFEWVARTERDGIRAVLFALAAMGEDVWPGRNDCARDLDAKTDAWDAVKHVHAYLRSHLSPVLGALRARVAELESVGGEMVAALDAWGKTCENKDEAYTYTSDDKRCDQAWSALRDALRRKS